MERKGLLFFSVLFIGISTLTISLYPQVKIKEKVEISPGIIVKNSDINKTNSSTWYTPDSGVLILRWCSFVYSVYLTSPVQQVISRGGQDCISYSMGFFPKDTPIQMYIKYPEGDPNAINLYASEIEETSARGTFIFKKPNGSEYMRISVILYPKDCPTLEYEFELSELKPGDTTNTLIKKKNINGSLIDFPPDQMFNAIFINKPSFGILISPNGEISTDTLKNTLQGFKYIAPSNISDFEVKDTILVETIIYDEPMMATRINNLEQLSKEALEDFNILKDIENSPSATICGKISDKKEVITKNNCEEWACQSEPKLPYMDVEEINCGNGTDKQKQEIKNYCLGDGDWGFFLPLWDGPLIKEPIFVEPCFYNGAWQFDYITNPLWLDAYLVFCPDCIEKGWILENITDVWRIPEDKLCDAMADFKAQKNYGANVTYKIKEATMIHERLHKNDFFTAKSKTLYKYPENSEKKYISLLVNTGWGCDKFQNYDETVEKMQNYWIEKVAEFKGKIEKEFEGISHSDDKNKNKEYEIGLWDKRKEIQEIIKDYIEEIVKRINSINVNRPENLKIKCK